ncbi:MAG: ATP-binding protein [Actinomycetota bacterium]|nr:ATP-binding protein [Actinomycetota bacterium]
MIASGSNSEWQQGQDALREEVRRVTALLRSIQDPRPHAVGQWNLGEVAMHLSQAWVAVPGLARRNLSPVHEVLPSLAGALPFLARTMELAALRRVLRDARRGAGTAAVVRGEAGIGKTRLLAEILAHAERRASRSSRVRPTSCLPTGRSGR